MTAVLAVPTTCPKCGQGLWDNRATKKNPRQPDFKCKGSPACDWVQWPPKGTAIPPAGYVAPAPAPTPYAPAPVVAAPIAPTLQGWSGIALTYEATLAHVMANVVPMFNAKGIPVTMEGVAAIAAHLNITRSQKGC
jgi:hypothetical protein